jgi:drug/metabolite transporter (DMT)-like permease
MTPSAQSSRRLAYVAWGAVCIIWGTTYLGIRVSLESIPPALMGGLRWTLAGGLLSLYLVARGRPLPPRAEWGRISILAFLLLGLGNGGVVFEWIPSGLTAVMVATAPFWMSGVEALMPDGERLRARVIAGLVIGFSGIVLLVWPDLSLGNASGRGFIAGVMTPTVPTQCWVRPRFRCWPAD